MVRALRVIVGSRYGSRSPWEMPVPPQVVAFGALAFSPEARRL